jgi:hypothetical protein
MDLGSRRSPNHVLWWPGNGGDIVEKCAKLVEKLKLTISQIRDCADDFGDVRGDDVVLCQ